MGEKKMLQKERKSPSQKKKDVAPAKPRSKPTFYICESCSCPSILGSAYKSYRISDMIRESKSGSGGITKSWVSPSSACGFHQTWPQLFQNCFYPGFDEWFYAYSGPWRTKQDRVIEPYSGDDRYFKYAEFTNSIDFQGKCYAISLQGHLALLEGSPQQITGFGRNRVVPHCNLSKHFREHFLVCEKEIYLVFLLSRGSIKKVDDVEVFRLDTSTSKLSWEKVDRLKGDAMFFVEANNSMAISASSLGCRKGRNCVYFSHDRADGAWFVYDMETSCISPTSGPEVDPTFY